MIVVMILRNKNVDLVAPEKPITPKKKVIKDINNTMLNGCKFSELIEELTIFPEDTDNKNSGIHDIEIIKDHRLILFFMIISPSLSFLFLYILLL